MSQISFVGNTEVHEEFRDTISTVDEKGNRVWLYPKNPKGKFTNYRNLVAVVLMLLMFSGPFLKINGEPVLLLNVIERKFIIFGKIFWPQDFHLFLLIMLAFMVFIVLFTVVYGRIFCGWMCPQTIFMESVFRKIEYWIEGDWTQRKTLDREPVTPKKFFKKLLKHIVFFSISFLIANTFLSYILGVEEVFRIWQERPANQIGTISALLVFTAIFYWVFARFREQVCTTVCPYGRLQGVLQDKNTLLVAYDYVRGEGRSKYKKGEDRVAFGKGDCVDCHHCVHVCPMGIDIRNGTQLECTNCTACIDACNHVMQQLNLKQGLIRFDSETGIAEKKPFRFTWRIAGYTFVLTILLAFIAALLIFRSDVEATVLRTPGVLFQKLPDNKISNLYNIKVVNKTNVAMNLDVKLISGNGSIQLIGNKLVLPAQGTAQTSAFIILDRTEITKVKTKLKLGVYCDGKELETVSTTFIGPLN